MVAKRRWRDFPARLKNELEGASAVIGVSGIGLGATGWGLLSPVFAAICVGVGGLVTMSTLGYAGYRAFPPKLADPSDLVGSEIGLDQLNDKVRKIAKVAIIGRSQAGKTTLKNRLNFDTTKTNRTEDLRATITALPTAPTRFIALLDGDGTKYRHQLEMAEVCDFLVIILDHNISDDESALDEGRVAKHTEFLEQVANSIAKYRAEGLGKILFLWNKRDLWQKAPPDESKKFEDFTASVFKTWSEANLANSVLHRPHSNDRASDVSEVMNTIVDFAGVVGDAPRS